MLLSKGKCKIYNFRMINCWGLWKRSFFSKMIGLQQKNLNVWVEHISREQNLKEDNENSSII